MGEISNGRNFEWEIFHFEREISQKGESSTARYFDWGIDQMGEVSNLIKFEGVGFGIGNISNGRSFV